MNRETTPIKVAVLGANGQLGQELQYIAHEYPVLDFHFFSKEECNLSDPLQMMGKLDRMRPGFIINAGAYTNVEKAESETALNDTINHLGVANLALLAEKFEATLIHVSTDYVFDGSKGSAYQESDDTNPINQYGLAKRKGEEAIQATGAKHIILRTSWLYSTFGHNFFKTMLKLSETKDVLNVVNDQVATPTYARVLARDINRMIIRLSQETIPSGIYHYTHQGEASWFDFATAIMQLAKKSTKVEACTSEVFPQVAKRPAYSKLDTTKFETQFWPLPDWKTALENCINDLEK